MGWWLWSILLGFVIIAAVIVAQMFSGSWLADAVKHGVDKWDEF